MCNCKNTKVNKKDVIEYIQHSYMNELARKHGKEIVLNDDKDYAKSNVLHDLEVVDHFLRHFSDNEINLQKEIDFIEEIL